MDVVTGPFDQRKTVGPAKGHKVETQPNVRRGGRMARRCEVVIGDGVSTGEEGAR